MPSVPASSPSPVLRRALPWLAGAVALTAGVGVFTSSKYARRKEQLERQRIGRVRAEWGSAAAGTNAPTPIQASGSGDPFLPLLILAGMLTVVGGTAFVLWRAGAATDRTEPPEPSPANPPSSVVSESQEFHS